jgi:hypothetical protein
LLVIRRRSTPRIPASSVTFIALLRGLEPDCSAGISGVRLREITQRFFAKAAEFVGRTTQLVRAEKLHRASPHWTTYTQFTLAPEEVKRAHQIRTPLRTH